MTQSPPTGELVARKGMSRFVWFFRWHVTRMLIHVGLMVAPRGPARTLLVEYLNNYGFEVMSVVEGRPK